MQTDQDHHIGSDPCEAFLRLADGIVDEDDTKLRSYDPSQADAKKYLDAVRGTADKVDEDGHRVSHVGGAVLTEDPTLWDPWCGFRAARPMTIAATGTGSKLRNRFCLNPKERERRRIDHRAKMRIKESISEGEGDMNVGEPPLPCVDQTRYDQPQEWGDHDDEASKILEGRGGGHDRDDEELDHDSSGGDDSGVDADSANFWGNLDAGSAKADFASRESSTVCDANRAFDLFQHEASREGVCDAVLDILELAENGDIADVQHVIETVENILQEPVAVLASSSECDAPDSDFECEIPCGNDGLPSEETVSFLFDGVSSDAVASRAVLEPAYRRLAALRGRVLARLNLPNG